MILQLTLTGPSRQRFWGNRVCKDPATQQGGRSISYVHACAQCYSCQIRDEMGIWSPSLFLFGLEGFPFPFRIHQSSLSGSERICVDLDEFEWDCQSVGGRENLEQNWMNLNEFECDWRLKGSRWIWGTWIWMRLSEISWIWVRLKKGVWIWANLGRGCMNLNASEWDRADLSESFIWVRFCGSEWHWAKLSEIEWI